MTMRRMAAAGLMLLGPCATTEDYILHGPCDNGYYRQQQEQTQADFDRAERRFAESQREIDAFRQQQLMQEQNDILRRRP